MGALCGVPCPDGALHEQATALSSPNGAPEREISASQELQVTAVKPELQPDFDDLADCPESVKAAMEAERAAAAAEKKPAGRKKPKLDFLDLSAVPENHTMVNETAVNKKPAFGDGGLFLDSLDAETSAFEQSVSATWIVDENGAMLHQKTGTQISAEGGISIAGKEYTLTADQIEVDSGGNLGAGACGQVKKGRIKSTGELVAIKQIKVDDKAKRSQMLSEVKILIECEQCDQLIKWYGAFMAKVGSTVMVVLEFMDLGSLRDLVNRLPAAEGGLPTAKQGMPPRELAQSAWQIFTGLGFLHDRRLLHRDIKPENILHSRSGAVKLTDFGISKELGDETAACTFMGTMTYMSPERCEGADYRGESDVWSCGLVLFEMSTGKYPFEDVSSFVALFTALTDDPEPRLDAAAYDANQCDFVAKCLTRDLAATEGAIEGNQTVRPNVATLLKHSFVNSNVGTQEELRAYLATLV